MEMASVDNLLSRQVFLTTLEFLAMMVDVYSGTADRTEKKT